MYKLHTLHTTQEVVMLHDTMRYNFKMGNTTSQERLGHSHLKSVSLLHNSLLSLHPDSKLRGILRLTTNKAGALHVTLVSSPLTIRLLNICERTMANLPSPNQLQHSDRQLNWQH